jgi:hypothetical protein
VSGNEDEKPAAADAEAEDVADVSDIADVTAVEVEVETGTESGTEAGVAAGVVSAAPEPLVVQCPQCAVPADAQSLCCPSCHEDLVALVRLRYAGRIAFNEALGLLRAGRREAAVVALERAVAVEPGLGAAKELLARLSDDADTGAADDADAAEGAASPVAAGASAAG